jgi:2-polyprenyl-3-methyl-5-hydroxy-6-metoxy-1,4-benzoquinol methylase
MIKPIAINTCYLCSSTEFIIRKGQVRDNQDLKILECQSCGLVTLSSLEHIQAEHYESSGMHGADPVSIDYWSKETIEDDNRRFQMLQSLLKNKKILDFGCGNGGFLKLADKLAAKADGVEPEKRVRDYWSGRFNILPDLKFAGELEYDLITAFHVIEHLPDPRGVLREISKHLASNGKLILEVPSSEDALITLYESHAFMSFTYWSQHIYLFNTNTLESLVKQAGLKVTTIQQYQRYPISNHLYWLSKGKPGGHIEWSFLDSPVLQEAYAGAMRSIGKCDTLIAWLEKD